MTETGNNQMSETELDDLLTRARAQQADASPELLARVMADANRLVDQRDTEMAQDPRRNIGRTAGFFAGLGGWPALAGLATATVAGIWIGYGAPQALDGLTQGNLFQDEGYGLADFMPPITDFLDEG